MADKKISQLITAGSAVGDDLLEISHDNAGTLESLSAKVSEVVSEVNVEAAKAVMEADYDPNTILIATADDTPVASTAADARAFLNVADGAGIGGGNAIINGNFDIWQRGTSFTSPVQLDLVADRWQVNFDGTIGTFTVSQQAFALGELSGEPRYFLRWDHTAAGSGSTFRQIHQKIEGVRTFSGEEVTVSFWGKADDSRTVSTLFTQNFGTGGSPSTNVDSSMANHGFTTSWQKFTQSVTLGSMSTKTIGTNDDDRLIIIFRLPLNTAMTINIARVQVELGDTATDFERRSIGEELALCLRYFNRFADGSRNINEAIVLSQDTSSTSARAAYIYPVPMRAAPTLAISNVEHFQLAYWASNDVLTVWTTSRATERSIQFSLQTNDGGGTNTASLFQTKDELATADLDAEL